ncbi:MAG TPA: alpha/beta hydrolase [Jatrophihabitantaceae bacterium]|jgi:pimeloyl-ACP methyl ester carboxylesterase
MATPAYVAQMRDIESDGGRRLRLEIAGDGPRVIVAQVGSPNAGVLYDRWVSDAARRGLTLIAYDRPGYGGSSAQPGRGVADCVADLRAISRAIGFERCAVWGFSGGGPHALAGAALGSDLVAAAATIGSPAPWDAQGLDYLAGMSAETRQDLELFESDRPEWEQRGRRQAEELLAATAGELADLWSAGASPPDIATLDTEFGIWLHSAVQAAVAPGADGWMADDIAIFHSSWGFDVSSIAVPVKVWHGRDDRFVPYQHGCWLADTIPGAQAELRDHDGHLTVVANRIGDVHDWLARYL